MSAFLFAIALDIKDFFHACMQPIRDIHQDIREARAHYSRKLLHKKIASTILRGYSKSPTVWEFLKRSTHSLAYHITRMEALHQAPHVSREFIMKELLPKTAESTPFLPTIASNPLALSATAIGATMGMLAVCKPCRVCTLGFCEKLFGITHTIGRQTRHDIISITHSFVQLFRITLPRASFPQITNGGGFKHFFKQKLPKKISFLKKYYALEIVLLVILLGTIGVFMSIYADTASNRANMPIIYQGRLMDASYIPKSDTDYYLAFEIYTASSGGTCKWRTETTQDGGCAGSDLTALTATTSRGLFTVVLGAGAANNPSFGFNFDTTASYLQAYVCPSATPNTTGSCETLTPRKQLGGVTYAYNADLLDGLNYNAFAILAGQSDGQTLIGGTATTDDLILKTTSGAAASGADMIFQTGNNGATEAIRILYDGKVGIGTTSPSHLLDIGNYSAGSNVENIMRLSGRYASADGTFADVRLSNSSDSGGSYFGIAARRESNNYGVSADFTINNTGAGATPLTAMTLLYSGNVGIGATTPKLTLHVAGTSAAPTNTGTTPTGVMRIDGKDGNVLDIGTYVANPYGTWLQTADSGNLATHYPLILNPLGGNVGIGTTGPTGALDVRDATSGLVGFSTSADVFGEVYVSSGNTINGVYNTNGNGELWLNYAGYLGSTTQFRDLQIGNGKNAAIAFFDGSSGNVGIGTAGPTGTLHVNSSNDHQLILSGTLNAAEETAGLEFKYNGGVSGDGAIARILGYTQSSGGGDILFQTAANGAAAYATKMTLSRAGSVGIGTTPTTWTVFSGIMQGAYGALTLGDSGSPRIFGNSYYNGGYKYQNTAAATQLDMSGGIFTFSVAPSGTAGDAVSWTTAATINNSGYVGIGTASPANALHVLKDTTDGISYTRFDNSDFPTTSETSQGVGLTFYLQSNLNGDAKGTGGSAVREGGRITIGKDSDWYNAAYTGTTIDSNMQFYTTVNDTITERMRITSDGYVGIGTTTPGKKLDIDDTTASATPTLRIQNSNSTNGPSSTAIIALFVNGSTNNWNELYTYGMSVTGNFQSTNLANARASVYNNDSARTIFATYYDNPYYFVQSAGGTATYPLTIAAGGNVGIGDVAPDSNLVIRKDSSSALGADLSLVNKSGGVNAAVAIELGVDNSTYANGAGNAQIKVINMDSNDQGSDMSFSTWDGSSFGERLRIKDDGVVTIANLTGAGERYVCVTATALSAATTCSASDIRLKTNITELTSENDVLASLKKLRGVYFNWKTDVEEKNDLMKTRQLGMIAQEVEAVFPELVEMGSDGYRRLMYDKFTGYLLEVAKAQQMLLDPLVKGITIDTKFTDSSFMTVDQDGHVGIGTDNPVATLDVKERGVVDDGIGKELFGLSSAVTQGDSPNYTIFQGKAITDRFLPTKTINQLIVKPNNLYSIEAKIIERNNENGNGGTFTLKGTFKTGENSPPIITQIRSSLDVLFRDSPLSVPSFDSSSDGMIKINVTGDENETTTWHSTVFVSNLGN